MKVYRVAEDVSRFQSVALCDEALWDSALFQSFECQEKRQLWKVPKLYTINPVKRAGDFFYLVPGVLVLNDVARGKLLDLFEMAGELLPVRLETPHVTLYLLNVLECPNALDQKKTKWKFSRQSKVKLGIEKYSFHKERLFESSVFKVPETRQSEILTFSGVKNQHDEFRSRYETSGLTGLVFEELWSDE